MKVDLHNHTIHSDGILTSEQLVQRAVLNHVDVFALTDHDSVFGDEEIVEIGKKYGVRVIKGMELSTDYKGESIHIVCLFKNNVIPDSILQFAIDFKETRKNRAIKMMELIRDTYKVNVDIPYMIEHSEVITRATMYRNILANNPGISKDQASFYVSKDSLAYLPSTKMPVEEGLKLARAAGCFVIFAHPCLVRNREYVDEILKYGFDGIEVRYPSVKNDEEYFTAKAREYNLLCSAGSDCHTGSVDGDHGDIGTCTLNEEEFAKIAKEIGFEL